MLGIYGNASVCYCHGALCEVAFNSIKLVLIKAILTGFGIEIHIHVMLSLGLYM